MTSDPANLAPEDQFLLWRQELETRQEKQARQVVELRVQTNQLREENERMRTQLEASRAEQSREPPRPFPPSRPSKGKEAAAPDDIGLPADDELSSGSSPISRRSLSPNAAEAHSRKGPPRQPSRSISVARRRTCRDQRSPMPSEQYVPDPTGGFPFTSGGLCTRHSGTAEHAFHSPWSAYPGLRSPSWLFHTTLCHVRRLLRSI